MTENGDQVTRQRRVTRIHACHKGEVRQELRAKCCWDVISRPNRRQIFPECEKTGQCLCDFW